MITAYGERNPGAPAELDLFSFLIGKWAGTGRTRLPDGNHVDWEGATWIGRYILDGMAIADEFHAPMPDGTPYLGISLRHFDVRQSAWIIEYLNVTGSFIRRQVNPKCGALTVKNGTIEIVSEDGPKRIRERYRLTDPNHFIYSTDSSADEGLTWDPVLIEMTMTRPG
jgi:hypothetical protein